MTRSDAVAERNWWKKNLKMKIRRCIQINWNYITISISEPSIC